METIGIPPNELPAATIEFKYDGLSRLIERKVTRGVDPPEVEGYQWDGWKRIMIAKLNTDGTFHSRKWSCVWRPDIGSSLYARSDWMRSSQPQVDWLDCHSSPCITLAVSGNVKGAAAHPLGIRLLQQGRGSGHSMTPGST
jgi:hypothetical protein